ncbi:MAG: DJ-1/PfpI family protein [Deltaproteobacteria bacterium]|nr:DJ-1/PfpI family protein [Deltaproteobacteria bacterium]
MKKVLIPIAPGFEEVEAITVVDILRRAGAEVVTAGVVTGPIEGRNGVKVLADTTVDTVLDAAFDMVVLPGGAKGTENLKKDSRVKGIVEAHFKKGKFIAAICAAPTILSTIGITRGKTVTCHPSVTAELKGEKVTDDRVRVDGNIITSRSPGTAMEFAFTLAELLFGKEKAVEVNKGVIAKL